MYLANNKSCQGQEDHPSVRPLRTVQCSVSYDISSVIKIYFKLYDYKSRHILTANVVN